MIVGDRVRWIRRGESFRGYIDQSVEAVVRFVYDNFDLLLELPEHLGPNLRYQRVPGKAVKLL